MSSILSQAQKSPQVGSAKPSWGLRLFRTQFWLSHRS